MKCRESSETRFPKVWRLYGPSLRAKLRENFAKVFAKIFMKNPTIRAKNLGFYHSTVVDHNCEVSVSELLSLTRYKKICLRALFLYSLYVFCVGKFSDTSMSVHWTGSRSVSTFRAGSGTGPGPGPKSGQGAPKVDRGSKKWTVDIIPRDNPQRSCRTFV